MKKVCIYCRVNTPEQAEGSIERMKLQNISCRSIAELHNLSVVKEIREYGVSGVLNLKRNRALREMIALSKRGEFDLILIPNLKTISRKIDVVYDFFYKVKTYGVEILSADEGKADEKMINVLKGAADYGRMLGENNN